MRINMSSTCFLAVIAVSSCWLFPSKFALGQDSSGKNSGIVSVSAWSQATVQIEVRASDKQLIIPYCKVIGTDENLLYCNQGLEYSFEYFDGGKWVRTKPGYTGEVFGFEPDLRKPAVVPPDGSMTFLYRFSPKLFHLRRGVKLRLTIYAWTSPESLAKNEKPASKFVSPIFICP